MLIQSFADEFEGEEEISAETPGAPGAVLTPVQNEIDAVKRKYRQNSDRESASYYI